MAYIDFHILQTVPPSNLNRDDTGSPKTGLYGGARRARVSSQSWKRATRDYFNKHLDASGVGYRTKRIVEIVASKIVGPGAVDEQRALVLAEQVIGAAGIALKAPKKKAKGDAEKAGGEVAQAGYLVFISDGQATKLAELAVAADVEGRAVPKKEAQAAFTGDQSIDLALFGRMVADDSELGVDAAAQVAHALSVHAVDAEFDYFSAVDDLQRADKQQGAGMIGTIEFNSATLYRYATLSVEGLAANLGDAGAAALAARTFAEAFIRSMPTGKQNTFAAHTPPDAVVVVVRDDQPVNLVGAFENPLQRAQGSIVARAVHALAGYATQVHDAYGGPRQAWVAGPADNVERLAAAFGSHVPLDELVEAVETATAGALEARA
jgi:CRISPR system Cascade subunit CasC